METSEFIGCLIVIFAALFAAYVTTRCRCNTGEALLWIILATLGGGGLAAAFLKGAL